jgi:eukaryotic-like serine/threonine-protein kinase
MSAATEPVRPPQPRRASGEATVEWLDALADGKCTPEEFLDAMGVQSLGDREEDWEVLSLLDQYYRRGRLNPQLFRSLRSHLEDAALSRGNDPASRTAPAGESHTSPATARPGKAPPPVRPAVREVNIGALLRNRYRVCGIVGHGGMGTVFEATDEYRVELASSHRRLAIKVLHTEIARREELLTELQREFQHLQLLSHPNIVRVHEFDRDGDVAFFTMELLSGALLSHVFQTRNSIALPRPYAWAVIRDVGAALAHAHSRGVIHGDINPQNIFVTHDGQLRVLDFGASHSLLADRRSGESASPARSPVATPGYASCQLLEGWPPDARDDLFAFACVAYLLLSGQHPFPRRTALEARAQQLRPRRPPGLSGRQWRVLREGLRWSRAERPPDVQRWLDRLGLRAAAPRLPPLPEVIQSRPVPRGNTRWVAAALVVLALLGAGGYWAAMNRDSLAHNFTTWRSAETPASPPGASSAAPMSAAALPEKPSAAPIQPTNSIPAQSLPAQPIPAPAPAARQALAYTPPARAASTRAADSGSVRTGPVRIAMAADTLDVPYGDARAHVSVRRSGSVRGPAIFTWWTEAGTGKPGVDFVPVMPHTARIEDGSSDADLTVAVVYAAARKDPKSFYVVIDQAESGPTIGARAQTLVTLLPRDQPAAP